MNVSYLFFKKKQKQKHRAPLVSILLLGCGGSRSAHKLKLNRCLPPGGGPRAHQSAIMSWCTRLSKGPKKKTDLDFSCVTNKAPLSARPKVRSCLMLSSGGIRMSDKELWGHYDLRRGLVGALKDDTLTWMVGIQSG